MTDSKTLRTIKKLLNLANAPSATEGEAANAASRAQALMTKHQISEASLDLNEVRAELIKDWEDPLDSSGRLPAWRAQLAMAIAAVNSCQVYRSGSDLKIIGEEGDTQSVRCLYAFLIREITSLGRNYSGNGRTWTNNWRHGVVDTLRARLKEAHGAAVATAYTEASTGTALVMVDTALAVIKERERHVERIGREMGLVRCSGSRHRSERSARDQGRRDGGRININGNTKRLT
jgi:hypothetical protein